jgi:hypothetical protein
MQNSLEDMTGGVCEVIDIYDTIFKPNIFDHLHKSFSMNSLIGAAIYVSRH